MSVNADLVRRMELLRGLMEIDCENRVVRRYLIDQLGSAEVNRTDSLFSLLCWMRRNGFC